MGPRDLRGEKTQSYITGQPLDSLLTSTSFQEFAHAKAVYIVIQPRRKRLTVLPIEIACSFASRIMVGFLVNV